MKDITTVLRDFRSSLTEFSAGEDLKLRLRALCDHYPSDYSRRAADRIISALGGGTAVDPYQLGLHSDDIRFADQIEAVWEFLRTNDAIDTGNQPRQTSKQEDFIASDSKNQKWSLLKCINFALLLTIVPNKDAALVASIRNEGLSILEWI